MKNGGYIPIQSSPVVSVNEVIGPDFIGITITIHELNLFFEKLEALKNGNSVRFNKNASNRSVMIVLETQELAEIRRLKE